LALVPVCGKQAKEKIIVEISDLAYSRTSVDEAVAVGDGAATVAGEVD
jgi:hypothetical protein